MPCGNRAGRDAAIVNSGTAVRTRSDLPCWRPRPHPPNRAAIGISRRSRLPKHANGSMRHFPPRRIVCLTEETVETLYLLREQDRIVGVSGYAVRPPQVRKEKPRVSAFISADIPKILALEPDLVLAFSDLQGQLAADLAKAGIAVHVFNQRDIA